jgi:hypothetical protein
MRAKIDGDLGRWEGFLRWRRRDKRQRTRDKIQKTKYKIQGLAILSTNLQLLVAGIYGVSIE